jgi:putative spermidine/putrescine transport system substrate-binding protein
MLRNRLGLACAALALLVAAPVGSASARDLTVVSWGGAYQDAQRKIYFEPFTAAEGTKLVEDSWNGGVGTLRAKVEGGNADWDVVQVEAEELYLGCDEGLFELMSFDVIGGKDAYLPAAVHECGVGAIVWSTALSYDGDKLGSSPPASWADFFDTTKFPGKRGLRKGPKYALEFALMADGVPADQVYQVLRTPEGVDRAFNKLGTIKNDVVWWEAGAQPPQLLASGEVVMTSAYNGRITAANKSDKRNFKISWPGHVYAIDSWVILKDSPNKEAGLKFIAFAGDAKRQAELPPMVPYGVTNKDASALIAADVLLDVPTAPDNLGVGLAIDTEFWVDNIEKLTERFNGWVAQ